LRIARLEVFKLERLPIGRLREPDDRLLAETTEALVERLARLGVDERRLLDREDRDAVPLAVADPISIREGPIQVQHAERADRAAHPRAVSVRLGEDPLARAGRYDRLAR